MSILISEKHGMNPTMGLCSQCEKETGVILLLGKCNEYICQNCGVKTYGRLPAKERKCSQCGSLCLSLIETDIQAPRQLKTKGICKACETKNKEHAALVRQGGIYWRCQTCGSAGVVKPGTEFAMLVRHRTQIVAPNPVGVDFTSEECPVCQNQAKEKLDDSGARSKGR